MLVTAKSCNPKPSAIKANSCRPVKFYLLLFVVCVVVFLIAVRLGPLSVVIKVTFKVALAFLAIMIGRWLLGPRNL